MWALLRNQWLIRVVAVGGQTHLAAPMIAARLTGMTWARGQPRDRHSDEHARPDSTGGPQHRPRHRHPVAGAVFDDGDHGVRHDLRDIPAAVVGRQASTNVVTRRRARSPERAFAQCVGKRARGLGCREASRSGSGDRTSAGRSRHSFMMRMPNGLCRSK